MNLSSSTSSTSLKLVDSLQDINTYLTQHPNALRSGGVTAIAKLLRAFVQCNSDPSQAPNLRGVAASALDDPTALVGLFADSKLAAYDELVMLIIWTLKILSRKECNRVKFGEHMCSAVLQSLNITKDLQISRECANCILNLCYEKSNVVYLLDHPSLSVLSMLLKLLEQHAEEDFELAASVLGALQSMCYQALGRQRLFEAGGVQIVVPLLQSQNIKVANRAVSVVHNLSSYPPSIRIIRELNGIEPIAAALIRATGASETNVAVSEATPSLPVISSTIAFQPSHQWDATLVMAASGALQNMAREVRSRSLILDTTDAVRPLTEILFCDDVSAQISAASALLNLLGPEPPDAQIIDFNSIQLLQRTPSQAVLQIKSDSNNSSSSLPDHPTSSCDSTTSIQTSISEAKAVLISDVQSSLRTSASMTLQSSASSSALFTIHQDPSQATFDVDTISNATRSFPARVRFKKTLAECVALGALYNVLFPHQPRTVDPDVA